MEKNLKMTIENSYLTFYENGQLHPCNISFFDNNQLKIQKSQISIIEPFSKKQLNIAQQSMSFNLKINLTFKFKVSMRKVNLSNLGVHKIQVLILNKETSQQLRLYVPKNAQNYLKLYTYLKNNCFLQKFDQFFEMVQMLKYSSQKSKSLYFIVQQKATLKNKMVRRYSKNEIDISQQYKLIKQIQIQNKLNCSGIIKFDGFFQDNEFLYIVYNQTPNKSLKDFIKQFKQFDKVHAQIIMKQLLEAALQLQINGIAHNNIQPNTIQLINDNQSWKSSINHFSNALLLGQWTIQEQNNLIKYYGYSAPQILYPKNGKLSYKSDVFSIGSVFYYMMFGKQLFKIPNEKNHIFVDSYPNVDFQSEEMKSLPFEALQLMKSMLQFNPDKRISIVDALTHRYFTTRLQSIGTSLIREQTSRSRSKTPKKHHNSVLQTQITKSLKMQIKQNSNPLYETSNSSFEERRIKLKFSHLRKEKKKAISRLEQGQIDSDDIDDSHISLQPRNSATMTPSYDHKKTIEFKFFTI